MTHVASQKFTFTHQKLASGVATVETAHSRMTVTTLNAYILVSFILQYTSKN